MQRVKIDNRGGACPLEYKIVEVIRGFTHVHDTGRVEPGQTATGTLRASYTLYVRTAGTPRRGRWVMVRPGVSTYKPRKRKPAKRKKTKAGNGRPITEPEAKELKRRLDKMRAAIKSARASKDPRTAAIRRQAEALEKTVLKQLQTREVLGPVGQALKRRATKIMKQSPRTRKNPQVPKKEKPPKEWFYYKEALTRKRGAADPGAVVGNIWWNLADTTKARIIRNKNKARARGRAVVVTSRGTVTRRQVVKDIGKAAADRLYKKLKPSKREVSAAKKALK